MVNLFLTGLGNAISTSEFNESHQTEVKVTFLIKFMC